MRRCPAAARLACITSLVAAACARQESPGAATEGQADDTAVVREAFVTAFDTRDDVDSPAAWHGPGGRHWLLATAKSTHAVIVSDAATGSPVGRIGAAGTAAGQLRRPNGIAVVDSLLLVVERDNHRVQIFALPGFAPLGTFGGTKLRRPYGIAVYAPESGRYVVYVTDNYELPDGSVPPQRELGARVKQFEVTLERGAPRARLLRQFGDTAGDGVLRVVESIAVDPVLGRLLIAEEMEGDSHLKVYDLDGRFTGEIVGRGRFPQEAEGIALYACPDSSGYWLATDQGEQVNTYHLFDRRTLEHRGAFTGAAARLTDGVALTSRAFGPFRRGALYVSHLDGAIAAFSWEEVLEALGLPECP